MYNVVSYLDIVLKNDFARFCFDFADVTLAHSQDISLDRPR